MSHYDHIKDTCCSCLDDELEEMEQDLKEAGDKLREVASLIEDFLEDASPVDRRELEKFCRSFRV